MFVYFRVYLIIVKIQLNLLILILIIETEIGGWTEGNPWAKLLSG